MSTTQIETVIFQPGESLFQEGEIGFHFFVIQSGQVEIFRTGSEEQKIPLAVVSDGASIGEFAMIDRKPRSATARALTEVQAAKVSEAAYQELLTELPDWAVAVMTGLVDRLRQTNEIIRRSGIIDRKVMLEIQSVEFDADADEIEDDNPDLG